MPALRSSSRQQSTITEAFSRDTRTSASMSTSTSQSRAPRLKQTKGVREASKLLKPLPNNEVIEISSDSEDDYGYSKTNSAVIHNLQKQIAQLKDENMKQKRDLDKYKQTFSKGKVTLDSAKTEEILNCEICTGRMWSPQLLPDCGHCFCQSCLRDWFRTTLTKFTAENPGHNPNTPNQRSQPEDMFMHPRMMNTLLAAIPANIPRPRYSCPTCREIVSTRPVEVYALKAIIRAFASATGEKSPQKELRGRGGSKAVASPWYPFFPT